MEVMVVVEGEEEEEMKQEEEEEEEEGGRGFLCLETRFTVSAADAELESYLSYAADPLLAVGCFVSFIAVVGLGGVCFRNQRLLNMIGRDTMFDSLDYYAGIEGTKKISKAWNAFMAYFECCGVDNYADFYNRPYWPPKSVKGIPIDLETPVICCKGNSSDYACATKGTANTDNNNMETVS
ncbi:tetraspanin [Plakobranchus ocellatus]|uniref:Tetraspanin n=1 Tax=Plakobranchus ocellatus TaxID=259542 RepID=A0AAV3ZGC4_9GAST|nr:tetraspanin [Plakobranchus ocellatus]